VSRYLEVADADLVEQARTGDRAALDTLLRRHHDRIHLLCLRLCRDRGEADDATQEALIAIVRGLDGFDGRSSFSTWSYRIATNRCLDELRRRRRRPVPVDDTGPEPVSTDEDPADGAVRSGTRQELLRALADLPDEFRVPVVLRDVLDLDYAAIAEVLGVPPGTVRSRLSRARARLAATLTAPHGNPAGTGDVEETRDHGTDQRGAPRS